MNENKIQKLFDASRQQPAPEPPSNFAAIVAQAIRREAQPRSAAGLGDQLGALFPRLAWTAAIVFVVCAAGELYFAQTDIPLATEITELADEWLFVANEL